MVVGNRFLSTWTGIDVFSGAEDLLRHNRVLGAREDGIHVDPGPTGTVVSRNVAFGSGDDGIEVAAPDTRIRANRASHNHDLGIDAVAGVLDAGANRARANGNPLQCANVFCR